MSETVKIIIMVLCIAGIGTVWFLPSKKTQPAPKDTPVKIELPHTFSKPGELRVVTKGNTVTVQRFERQNGVCSCEQCQNMYQGVSPWFNWVTVKQFEIEPLSHTDRNGAGVHVHDDTRGERRSWGTPGWR